MNINPYSFEQLLDGTLAAQAVFTGCYFISTLVLSGNAFDGFNAVMLGLVYGASIALTYFKIRKDPSRIMYGIILGISVVLMIISLQSAIFWGQYAGCESSSSSSTSYSNSPTMAPTQSPTSSRRFLSEMGSMHEAYNPFSTSHRQLYISEQCKYRSAMRSVCAFSVFMFLSYIFEIALLVRYKDNILKASTGREGYAAVPNPMNAQPAVSSKIPSSYGGRPGSRYVTSPLDTVYLSFLSHMLPQMCFIQLCSLPSSIDV